MAVQSSVLRVLLLVSVTGPLSLEAGPALERAGVRDYCIVGAGPAGIQLGHFFYHAKRDYVIYERSPAAGSFFARYPRHRNLISLNKRSVREGRSAEFAFRHDWNSLIDVRPEGNRTKPVTERTEALFPHADVLVEYLADFAAEQAEAIRYGVSVLRIQRDPAGEGFVLFLDQSRAPGDPPGEGSPSRQRCREVVIATGLFKPRGVKTRIDGAEHVEGYEGLPETGESFKGKSVMVLGLGNAALETSQELQKHTAELHLFARPRPLPQGGSGVRFAYETHYVGDIRAGRTTLLDTYLLKSLDTFDFNALQGMRRLVVIPCQGSRRCVWMVERKDCADDHCLRMHRVGGQRVNYWLHAASWVEGGRLGQKVRAILAAHAKESPDSGWTINAVRTPVDPELAEGAASSEEADDDEGEDAETQEERARRRQGLGILEDVFEGSMEELLVTSDLLRESPELLDALVPIRSETTMGNVRHPFDHIVRCFGWAMDTSIFDQSTAINTTHNGKYPQIGADYQAIGVPGLYFAGTLGHGLDFRKSAGGFIHGFRYTARALFRITEEKNFGVPWPSTVVPLWGLGAQVPCGVDGLVGLLLRRINEASGPYQMFQSLGDMVVFEGSTEAGWQARFLEEVPLAVFEARFRSRPRLTWVFKYAEGFHGPEVLGWNRVGSVAAETAELSNFLHPHLAYTPGGSQEPTRRHWLTEDIFTHWTAPALYAPMARFVASAVVDATGEPALGRKGAYSLEPQEDPDACPVEGRASA